MTSENGQRVHNLGTLKHPRLMMFQAAQTMEIQGDNVSCGNVFPGIFSIPSLFLDTTHCNAHGRKFRTYIISGRIPRRVLVK